MNSLETTSDQSLLFPSLLSIWLCVFGKHNSQYDILTNTDSWYQNINPICYSNWPVGHSTMPASHQKASHVLHKKHQGQTPPISGKQKCYGFGNDGESHKSCNRGSCDTAVWLYMQDIATHRITPPPPNWDWTFHLPLIRDDRVVEAAGYSRNPAHQQHFPAPPGGFQSLPRPDRRCCTTSPAVGLLQGLLPAGHTQKLSKRSRPWGTWNTLVNPFWDERAVALLQL